MVYWDMKCQCCNWFLTFSNKKIRISMQYIQTLGAVGLGCAVSTCGLVIGVDVWEGAGNWAAILRPGLAGVVSCWNATSFSGGSCGAASSCNSSTKANKIIFSEHLKLCIESLIVHEKSTYPIAVTCSLRCRTNSNVSICNLFFLYLWCAGYINFEKFRALSDD
mgnify:CR=1 FL=1